MPSPSLKKKILYVITKSNWGGAQRYVYDLATSLPKEQFETAVAFGQGGALEDRLREAGIRTLPIPSLHRDINPILEFANLFSLIGLYNRERPFCVHLNSSKIGGLGALAGRLCGVPKIIFTAHGFAFNEDRNFIGKSIVWFASWITCLLCHSVIVLSEREKQQAMKMPFVGKKVVVIKNGISVPAFKTKEEARTIIQVTTGQQFPPDALWIGTISELHPNKGLFFILEALTALIREGKNILFFVMGEGEQRKKLVEYIQERSLEKNVFLLGHTVDAATYLKAFDIFSLTSQKEGLPYAVIEAGFAGVPIVSSKIGGIPELITHMESGILTEAGSVQEIKEALTLLLGNKELRQKFADNAHTTMTFHFTKEAMVTSTLALYTTAE